MKIQLDCFPCFMRQALSATRMATDDETIQREVIDRVARLFPTISLKATPVDMGQAVHRIVRESTGVADPYAEAKRKSNNQALAFFPKLKKRVVDSPDRLLTALQIAAAGNIIDFGPEVPIDLEESIEDAVNDPIESSAYRAFTEKLNTVNDILYLGDNAGEIVCDRILIEELIERGKSVTFAVRGSPVLNDVTTEDASYVGVDQVAKVITNGADAPGMTLSCCSTGFLKAFREAPMIIAKGQGNFEGLSEVTAPLFFLFKVKCTAVAQAAGAKMGAVVLKEQRRREGEK